MKKFSMILFAAASLSFVACSGEKKTTDAPAQDEKPNTEVTAEPAINSDEALAKYEELVNKTIPLLEKMRKGDVTAATEYQKLNKEINEFLPLLQKAGSSMTPEQTAKFQELAKKLSEAATPK